MADIRERPLEGISTFEEAIRVAVASLQASMWTAIPCVLTKDSDGHTCAVKPLIKGRVTKDDGSVDFVEMPIMEDIPVHFPQGGKTVHTFPLKKDDEILIVMSARPIDAWHQSGGVQQPIDTRMHSLSDGFAFAGFRSTPRKLKNVSAESSQMRSEDGKHFVDLHPTNGTTVNSTDPNDDNKKQVVTVHPTNGVTTTVTDGTHTHKVVAHPSNGIELNSGDQHKVTVHPTNGIKLNSATTVELTAPNTNLTTALNLTGGIIASGIIHAAGFTT